MKVVIAGGGTAGHVNPAIALARALDDDVTFVGTRRGAEAKLVPSAGFALEEIDVRGFDRGRPATLLSAGLGATVALGRARRILRRAAADVCVGMGGYVSLPVCAAARTMRVPVVLHEQNIVLGLSNKVCRRFACRVAVSFEETIPEAGPRAVHVGNPIAEEIATMDHAAERARGHERFALDPKRATLLAFGGSQGARRINEAVAALAGAWHDRDDVQIVHITGGADDAGRRESEEGVGLIYRRLGFVDRMAEAYAVADLAVCRGGATTVAELAAAGLPSIVVPYPHHRDRQQERHGRSLERAGAAVVVSDRDLTRDRLAAECDVLLTDRDRLAAMTRAARSLSAPHAAADLARIVRECAR